MHIWLFSSGGSLNEDIDLALMHHFNLDNPRLTFIPSSFESSSYYFEEFSERFSRYGFQNINIFHADQPFTKKDLNQLLNSEMIYLSGGNTFYFLAVCKKIGLFEHLIRFSENGGIISGHSAGAILLTPNITTASYPEDDRDENEVGIEDWTAAGLVKFEVFPHYDSNQYYEDTLKRASIQSKGVIYGVSDGAAIYVNDGSTTFFGDIWAFNNGASFMINGG